MKLCECGCGGIAPLAPQSISGRGIIKGQPLRFIARHYKSRLIGKDHPMWRGGVKRVGGPDGYIMLHRPEHRKAVRGYVYEHVLVAEHALGHPLPNGAEIHHANGIKDDNRNANLVICENHEYHHELHVRRRAVLAGFPAHWRRCMNCTQYDDPLRMLSYLRACFHRAKKGACDVQ